MKVSVIIPSYNPVLSHLVKVLNALKNQTLPLTDWELILIDNNSSNQVLSTLDLSWHRHSKIVPEKNQGLTHSRIRGFQQAAGELIVMVDDDNILATDYLEQVVYNFSRHKKLGAIGGIIEAEFNGIVPENWTKAFLGMLAIRNFGDHPIISEASLSAGYPGFAPVGAGMAIKRSLLNAYVEQLANETAVIADRTGSSLSSGGDNEIVIMVLKQGHTVGYFNTLKLQHIIPASRITKAYLARLNFESSRSWAALLEKHGLNTTKRIPKWSIGIRKLRSWLVTKAWSSPANYVNWKGTCGIFEGLAKS